MECETGDEQVEVFEQVSGSAGPALWLLFIEIGRRMSSSKRLLIPSEIDVGDDDRAFGSGCGVMNAARVAIVVLFGVDSWLAAKRQENNRIFDSHFANVESLSGW